VRLYLRVWGSEQHPCGVLGRQLPQVPLLPRQQPDVSASFVVEDDYLFGIFEIWLFMVFRKLALIGGY
jgi:hypothetical protein